MRKASVGSIGSQVPVVISKQATFLQLDVDEEFEQEPVDHCCSWIVIHEGNLFREVWTMITFFLLVYTATAFLYRLSFLTFHINEDGEDPIGLDNAGWNAFDECVDCLFWVDLVLNFFLSYEDQKGNEVDSLRRIVTRYASGYFWLNLLACLPESAVEALFSAMSEMDEQGKHVNRIARVTRLQRVSRLARLVRITRLAKLFSLASSNPQWNRLQSLRGVRIVNFIGGLVWTLHLLACGWYLCAALHADPQETWVGRRPVDKNGTSLLNQGPFEQWLVSMYFVLTVFTTVGFGDISAGTEAEIIYVGFTMVVGAVVHSIIISEVISLVTSTDQVQDFVDRNRKLLDAFCDHTSLSDGIRRRMKDEIAWRAKSEAIRASFNKEELQRLITGKLLPRWLLNEMSVNLFCGDLKQNKFLIGCEAVCMVPPRMPLLLAMCLARVEFEAGEIVYQMHDFPFNLFLVLTGCFAHVARPSRSGGVDEMVVEQHVSSAYLGCLESFTKRVHDRSVSFMSHSLSKGVSTNDHLGKILSDSPNGGMSRGTSPSGLHISLYPYRLYSCRNYFGELEILLGCPRVATTRCEKAGTALVLAKADMTWMQDEFPHFRGAWEVASRHRERYRLASRRKLTSGLTLRHFAARRIQSYFRLKWNYLTAETLDILRVGKEASCPADEYVQQTSTPEPPTVLHRDHSHDFGLRALHQVEDLRHSMVSMRQDFHDFRNEMRHLLKGRCPECESPRSYHRCEHRRENL